MKRLLKVAGIVLGTVVLAGGVLAAMMPSLRHQLVWSAKMILPIVFSDPVPSSEEINDRLREDPNDADAWHQKAEHSFGPQSYDEALNAIDKAIDLESDNLSHRELKVRIIMRSSRDKEEVKRKLMAYAEESPDDEWPWIGLYWSYGDEPQEVGPKTDAISRALGINPDNYLAHWILGQSLLGQGLLSESLPHLDRALELLDATGGSGDVETGRRGICLSQRALALSYLGRHEEAVDAAVESRRILPNDPFANMPLVYSLTALGRHDEALSSIVGSDFPGVTSSELLRAYVLLDRGWEGDREAAREKLLPMVEYIVPSRDDVYALALIGDRDGAIRTSEEYCENNPAARGVLRCAPELASLRGDPRFEAIVAGTEAGS